MARVDSLLDIVVQARADELRLGAGKAPRVLRSGVQQRFAMPETSEQMLRELLGPLLSEEREGTMRGEGRAVFAHTSASGHVFEVRLLGRAQTEAAEAGADAAAPLGFDVVFLLRGQIRQEPPQKEAELPLPIRARASAVLEPAAAPVHPVASPSGLPPAGPPPAVPSALSASAPAGLPWGHPAPIAGAAPIIGARLAALLSQAAALGATDLHLCEGEAPVCRVDGALGPLSARADFRADAVELLGESLVPQVVARLHAGASADFAAEVPGAGRCRVNVYRTTQGLAAAIRILPAAAPDLDQLGLPTALRELTELTHGLVLVCGPTGSGKSSTLAALTQEALRRRPRLLITLEDPIEYRFQPGRPGGMVRQREVGLQVRDMVTGLRDALREDPDLLLIGEMRDPETIALALTAAETGRLVLATLHSRTATSSIERIVDSYPPERQEQVRAQLADALRAVISQRLVPRAGTSGRVPAIEVLRGTSAVATLIRERRTNQLPSTMQAGKAEGMQTMERSLADLVLSRQITQETAEAATEDRASLRGYLKR